MFEIKACIHGLLVTIQSDFAMDANEARGYAEYGYKKFGDDLIRVEVRETDDPEFVEIRPYKKSSIKFERIRRITGYLVGTLDRFNDAKRAEVSDRVKHGV